MGKAKKKTAWEKDARYAKHLSQATVFRLVLDGDREAYLKLRNTFGWWRWIIRAMDFYLSSAESAFSVLEPGQLKAFVDKQAEKRKEAAEKRIAAGDTTREEENKREKVAAKVKPSAAELGFRLRTYNAAAKAAESARQGVKGDAGANLLYYEMRTMFFRENGRAVKEGGCLPMASHLWDHARAELTSMRDKELPQFGHAKRSWMVTRGVLGNLEAQNARIPFLRTYNDHCAEFGDIKGHVVKGFSPIVKFVEEGQEQHITLCFSKNPEVRLKFVVTGTVRNPDGKEWKKTPPESVRAMFHRFATGTFPATTSYLNMDDKGRLSLSTTFKRPPKAGLDLDKDKTLEVVFSSVRGDELPPPRGKKQEDALQEMERVKDMQYVIHMLHQTKSKRCYVERIAVNSALVRLDTFDKLKRVKEFERDSQRYFPKRMQKRLNDSIRGYTQQREALQTGTNHQWTKTVIHKALKWRCGKIVVYNLPKNAGLLLSEAHPWKWSHFGSELESKAKYYGFKYELRAEKDMSSLNKAIRETFSGDETGDESNGKAKVASSAGSTAAAV